VSDLFSRVTPAQLNFAKCRIKKIATQHHLYRRGCGLLSAKGNFVVREPENGVLFTLAQVGVRGQGVEFSAPRADNSSGFHITHSSSGCIEFNYQLVKTTALGSDEYENSGGRAGDPPK
jgi:hypothetical protein